MRRTWHPLRLLEQFRLVSKVIQYSVIALVALVLLAMFLPMVLMPLVLLFHLMFGWIGFLWQAVPHVEFDAEQFFVGCLAAALLTVSLHTFFRWLYSSWRRGGSVAEAAGGATLACPRSVVWPFRWTVIILGLGISLFIAGIAIVGVTHQVVWLATMKERWFESGYAAQRRNHSLNQLRQLSLAAELLRTEHGSLPAGCTTDGRGRLLHGWQTQLLPYLEEGALYDQIDLRRAWDSPVNAHVFQEDLDYLRNPGVNGDSHDEQGYGLTHYAANVHVLGGDQRRTAAEIPDGTAKTLLCGEAAGNYPAWGSATNWRDPLWGLNRSDAGFGGPWTGATAFAYIDGHAQILPNDIDPQVLAALATPAGGESSPHE